MSGKENQFTPNMPWTVERQLKAYANAEGHTDRHEILYHTWKQNSRWFTRMLEYTTGSYPRYGQHNAIHCQAVIHNIECLLGEDEIKRLSPTDCYAILMAVYMHDVGMCITEKDKREAVSSTEFVEWIDRHYLSDDIRLTDDIVNLRRSNYNFVERKLPEQLETEYKKLYNQKLDSANSTENLIAEFRRERHAETSANWLKSELLEPSEMSYGLSLTGIPKRIHLAIADCAFLHGLGNMEDLMAHLMAMRQEDNGYASDLYHPRFVAVLLLMGDALDIDNDRFHPNVRAMASGDLGEVSETHYRKHQSIRSLQITPKRISVSADCEQPPEMRKLYNEISWLQRFVTECSYEWSNIAPDDYHGYLPRVEFDKISLGGKAISEKLVEAKFQLSQQKVFKLLEGVSLYENHFVYLREMLQNAIDAVKLQYWNDLEATEFPTNVGVTLCEANSTLPLRKYPISVSFALRKRHRDKKEILQSITLEDIQATEECKAYDYGVEISVQDCGIGIGEADVIAISQVGISQDQKREFIKTMPDWLMPTGRFGIGLQALFQADNLFKCITRTHGNECYEMTFHSGTNNGGYINVIPRHWQTGPSEKIPYGTRVTLFVPHTCKESHTINMAGWASMDPYKEEYGCSRYLRRSFALMKQMEAQLEEWIGDSLFPVMIREEELDPSLRQEKWDEKVAPHEQIKFKKIGFQTVASKQCSEKQRDIEAGPQCWLFQTDDKKLPLRGHLEDRSAYYWMDVEQCRLRIWSEETQCFFACSSKRIAQAIAKDADDVADPGEKIKVFLKGLLTGEVVYKEDVLIEYIDIKNDRLQNHLLMGHNGFTTEGEEIIRTEIMPELKKTLLAVLTQINQNAVIILEQNRDNMEKDIVAYYRQLNAEEGNNPEEKGSFYIRKKELLEKRLHNYDLFDFVFADRFVDYLTPNAENDWKYQNAAGLVSGESNTDHIYQIPGCHRLRSCIDSELFSDFPRFASADYSFETRMYIAMRNRAERIFDQRADVFSVLLNTFFDKMEKIYSWFSEEQPDINRKQMMANAQWIRDFMLLHAMCFFYVNQSSLPKKEGCTAVSRKNCGWSYINFCVAHVLTDFSEAEKTMEFVRRDGYAEVTQMLFIPAVAEESLSDTEENRCSVAEMMLPENHFAVFSTRQSPFDPWKHMVIRLCPIKRRQAFLTQHSIAREELVIVESIKRTKTDPNILDILNYTPDNKTECAARWALLDHWFEFSIRSIIREWFIPDDSNPTAASQDGARKITEDVWGTPVAQWIANMLPTIALGSDTAGNNRLNILAASPRKDVFFDARMIRLVMERQEVVYNKFQAQRFKTTVWDGLGGLACKDVSTNILTVSRGLIPAENRKEHMLLAYGSVLPQEISLELIPTDIMTEEEMPTVIGRRTLSTFFDLLRAIQECYRADGAIPNFALESLHRRIKEYRNIQECNPFYHKYKDQDWKIILALQNQIRSSNNDANIPKVDRMLMMRNQEVLQRKIQGIFRGGNYSAEESLIGTPTRMEYKNITIPLNRQRFMCAYFITVYGLDVGNLPKELKEALARVLSQEELNLQPYTSNEKVEEAYRDIRVALEYGAKRAKADFHDAFLEHLCDWYENNVWKKEPVNSFLAFTQKHLVTPCSEQELRGLYRAQWRRIFWSAIAGIDTKLLE